MIMKLMMMVVVVMMMMVVIDDDNDDTLSRGPRIVAPQDVQTGRALVMKRSSLQSREGRAVYDKEASTMRSVAHPNIVQVKLLVYFFYSRWDCSTRRTDRSDRSRSRSCRS